MRKYTSALVAGLALAAGCKESATVAPVDLPTINQIQGSLTAAGLQTIALGVIAADRAGLGGTANYAYLVIPEIFARDLYRIDASEARYVTETLGGTPDPGSFSGSGGWNGFYTAVRAANTVLAALPGVLPDQVTPAQKSLTSGFVRTLKALDTYRVVELRDSLGEVVQVSDANSVTPDPLVCKPVAINYVAALLDSALADLTTAGASTKLSFALPTGYVASGPGGIDFSTQPNLIRLNRGLKGKVDVYRGLLRSPTGAPAPVAGAFATAITELTAFLNGAAPGAVAASTFSNGAYNTFVPTGTENVANPIADSRIVANPNAFAALQSGDTRASKFSTRSSALSGFGVSSTINYVNSLTSNSANAARPLALLRVEEAVLLRAQAYFESGNFASGTADLNSVRTNYGLAAYPTFTSLAAARTALLYEKRYSLFAEGPQRLVDLRAYGLLNAANTPAEVTGDPYNTALPIPKAERDARNGNITLSCS